MNKEEFDQLSAATELSISHIIEHGCDDIFKPPTFSFSLEHEIIKRDHADFRKRARTEVIKFVQQGDLRQCRIGQIHHSLVMKDHFTFRKVSWIDPFDLAKYLTITAAIFEKIDNCRIPAAAQIVHSHRRAQSGRAIFDDDYGYKSFRRRSGELSRENIGKWKVVTDIANFFDRIGNHPLENHLADAGCDKRYVELIREVLLFWAGDRRSFGVPIGSDASRILCEAALITVDRKLQERNIQFIRYVDDLRIFAETRAEAYATVETLITLLAEEGLSLNSKKTSIYKIAADDELDQDPNLVHQDEHETLNQGDLAPKTIFRQASGRSSLSRFYKSPGVAAIQNLRKIPVEQILLEIEHAALDDFEEIVKKGVKHFVYVSQEIRVIQRLLSRRITTVFYITDALIKEAAALPEQLRADVVRTLENELDPAKTAYPFKIPLIRLLSCEQFRSPSAIIQVVDNHRFADNLLFLREAILIGFSELDRARIRSLAQEQFRNVPDFVRRAIFYAVQKTPRLTEDERGPLLANMQRTTDDWFLHAMAREPL